MIEEILKQKNISRSARQMREIQSFMEQQLPYIIKKEKEGL